MWGLALLADETPQYRGGRRLWSMAEDGILRRRFPHEPTAALVRDLGRPYSSVSQRAARLGLAKSAAYRASGVMYRLNGAQPGCRTSQFKPGNVSHNKGLRRPGYSIGRGRMRETQFKPGQRAGNWMPIGSTRLIDGYVYLKISDVPNVPYTVNWKGLHIVTWERVHGPLPPKHVLWFKDGNRQRCEIENLELHHRRDTMARNTVHNLPKPLKETIHLLGQLKRRIRERTERDGEEQNHRSA